MHIFLPLFIVFCDYWGLFEKAISNKDNAPYWGYTGTIHPLDGSLLLAQNGKVQHP
jgi:hypothetical protein